MIDQVKEELEREFVQQGEPENMRTAVEQMAAQLDLLKQVVPYVFILELVGGFFNLIIYGLLLAGIVNRKGWMLLPYLIMQMMSLVMTSLLVFGAFVVLCIVTTGGVLAGFIFLALAVPVLSLGFYFWFVVRSVYLDTKELESRDFVPLVEKAEKYNI